MKQHATQVRGIICARCGNKHFKTTHTEPVRDGQIRRRKSCLQCGCRIVTFEGTLAKKC